MDEVNNLLNSVVFVSDREQLISEIESVKRSIFSVGSSEELEKSLKDSLVDHRARAFFDHLNKDKKNFYDGHIIEEILEALRKKAAELEVVTVYLPIDLDKVELTEMHKKLGKLLDKHILLRVEKEPDLLGGLRLEYNGVYLDLSLTTNIKKIIAQA